VNVCLSLSLSLFVTHRKSKAKSSFLNGIQCQLRLKAGYANMLGVAFLRIFTWHTTCYTPTLPHTHTHSKGLPYTLLSIYIKMHSICRQLAACAHMCVNINICVYLHWHTHTRTHTLVYSHKYLYSNSGNAIYLRTLMTMSSLLFLTHISLLFLLAQLFSCLVLSCRVFSCLTC